MSERSDDQRGRILPQLSWMMLPQLFLILLLLVYLALGAFVFYLIDENLREKGILEILLFEYGTLTTIGYGNVTPTNDHSRMFAVVFAIFGIPIILLTLANLGKYVTKSFWYLLLFLGFNVRSKISSDAKLPIAVIAVLFAFTFIGGSLFVEHSGRPFTIDDVYFSFISFATVGFGDTYPVINETHHLALTILYLTWGIILTSALFSILNDYLRKVHYLGRRFTGARDVPVWMGGQCMTVSQLLTIVANEFDASPREMRSVLRDLDDLISSATEEPLKDEQKVPLAQDIEDFDCYD